MDGGATEIPVGCVPTFKPKGSTKLPMFYDLTFGKEVQSNDLLAISFENFYVSSIGITMQLAASGGFMTVLDNKALMPKADCELNSNKQFTIYMSELNFASLSDGNAMPPNPSVLLRSLKSFRLYIYQPCPQWEHYELRNIRAIIQRSSPGSIIPAGSAGSLVSDNRLANQSIRSILAADLDFLTNLRHQQAEEPKSSMILTSEGDLERYRREVGKSKKDKKRRK